MKTAYIVSFEDMAEVVFMNRADAEEYVLHESYLEAMRWLHTVSDNTLARHRYNYYKSYIYLMLKESDHFYIEEVDFYE